MGERNSDLKRRFESLKIDALRFVEEMTGEIVNDLGRLMQRSCGVWTGRIESDRARAEELRHQLRMFTLDLAMAMERSPVHTKTDLRDIGRTGKRMCAALRFEEYTGSAVEFGKQIGVFDAKWIIEAGFEAMAQWVNLAPNPGPRLERPEGLSCSGPRETSGASWAWH